MKALVACAVAFLITLPARALTIEGLANGTSTTTTVTASLTTTGSSEVVFAAINSNCGVPNSVSGGGLTWTKVEVQFTGGAGGSAAGFTATAAAPLSAVTITGTVQSTSCGSGPTIGVLTVFGITGSGSVGVSTTGVGTTTQALTLNGTTAGSWVIALSTDWNTQGVPTYRADTTNIQNGHTINGSFSIDWFVCRTLNAGAGGSITVGSSAPTASTQFSMVAIEILSAAVTPPPAPTPPVRGTTRIHTRSSGTRG